MNRTIAVDRHCSSESGGFDPNRAANPNAQDFIASGVSWPSVRAGWLAVWFYLGFWIPLTAQPVPNGRLFFGSFLAQYRVGVLANDPVAEGVPNPDFPGDGVRTTLRIPNQGASLPGFPGYTFGNGQGIDVHLFANGDALFLGTGRIDLAGSINGSHAIGPSRLRYARLTLSQNGLEARDAIVGLPAGLGWTTNAQTRRLIGYLPLGVLPLDASLSPRVSPPPLRAADFGLPALWVHHERLPLICQTSELRWNPAEQTFETAAGSWEFARAQRQDALDQIAERRRGGDDIRGNYERLSNDLVFRQPSAGDPLVVKVDAQGVGQLQARVPLQSSRFLTHFPATLISVRGGQIDVREGAIQSNESFVETDGNVQTIYTPNCAETNCPTARNPLRVLTFLPEESAGVNRLRFTADAGLVGPGRVVSASLAWGNPERGAFAHQTSPFTDASLHLAGVSLRGVASIQPADFRPAELLLTGFRSATNPNAVERPGTDGYAEGEADYPGVNFRLEADGDASAESRLSGSPTGNYPLHHTTKYYVRPAGVSGRHQAQDFQGTLNLFGFATHLTSLGLAFLDNTGVDSRTSGSVHVPGPNDVPVGPSGFDLPFARLEFGCRGEPGPADLVTEAEPKSLSYWLTTFRPLSIAFETPTNTPACAIPAAGFLAVGALVPLPLIERPAYGVLAFRADGDLATAADGSRVDSRLHLPSSIRLAGPGSSSWRLTGLSRAYFNRWNAPGRPAEGFVTWFGALDVPFFRDIQVQVHAQPGLGPIGVSLMGGWHAEAGAINRASEAWLEGAATPFTKQTFDAANRGFTGPSVEAYRDPATVAYNPRAEQDWAGILHFDEPLQWRAAERGFRNDASVASGKERTLLFQLERRAQSLNAAGAEITFGAEPKLPRLSPNQLFLDLVDERTGLHRDLTAAMNQALGEIRDRSGLARAADRLDRLVSVHPDAFLRPALHGALRPLARGLVQVLQPAYEKGVRDAQVAGKDLSGQAQAARKEVCDLFTPVAGEFAQNLESFRNGASLVTNLAQQLDTALKDVEEGLRDVLLILEKRPVAGAIPPREERHVILEIARKFATPERLGEYGAVIGNEFVAHLADSLQREYLPELDPVFADVERQVRSVLEQVLAIRAQFQALSGPLVGTLDQIVSTGSEWNLWLGAVSNVVCREFELPTGVPEAFFREHSPAQLEERFLVQFEDEFLGRLFDDRLKFLFRSNFGEARGVFRGAVDELFAQINEMVRRQVDVELLTRGFPLSDAEVTRALDALDRVLTGTRLRGHARFNVDSLEELRLDGHFQFGLYGLSPGGGSAEEGIGFDGWYEAHQYQGASPAQGCQPEGKAAATVEVGAKFSPGGGFADGMKVGLRALASFGDTGQLLGVSGGVILGGTKDIAGASVTDPSLNFAFGVEGNYLGGAVAMSVKDFAGGGTLFVGEACRLAELTFADPDLLRVLNQHGVNPAGRIRGFWARADGTFPLERLLPIPPLGCLLHLEGRGGIGYYLLVVNDAPFTATAGVLVREGVSGKILCVLGGAGEVTLIGGATLTDVLSGSGPYIIGHGFLEGSVLGFKKRKDFEFNARLLRRGRGFDAEFHVPFLE